MSGRKKKCIDKAENNTVKFVGEHSNESIFNPIERANHWNYP